jgi:sulfoxide reductase catalytic subunit YedY
MLIKEPEIPASEITDERLYFDRRAFLTALAGAFVTGATGAVAMAAPQAQGGLPPLPNIRKHPVGPFHTDEGLNSYEDITGYNNFYEFGSAKSDPAEHAGRLKVQPWKVKIDGHVAKPADYNLEDLVKPHQLEERIYRLRCVEAWSMVIPWEGFPLASLLEEVEPTSDAKFVRFETVYRPDEMPGQRSPFYPWPYQEGLRLDEAMNDLTLLATGLYGMPMPNPNGAPIRLVVPWKYGFKSIKSIVKIELVAEQPSTLWSAVGPNEYGFYSNVNPDRPHPRWSQASERRIGEIGRRPTLMFNGYAEDVAHLYEGMDLIDNY